MIAPGHLVGTQSPIDLLQVYQADLLGPIVPTFNELLTTHHLSIVSRDYGVANFSENTSYIGLPLIFLLAIFRRSVAPRRVDRGFGLAGTRGLRAVPWTVARDQRIREIDPFARSDSRPPTGL